MLFSIRIRAYLSKRVFPVLFFANLIFKVDVHSIYSILAAGRKKSFRPYTGEEGAETHLGAN